MAQDVVDDWQNREFIETVEVAVRKCVDFLNNFHESAKYRLSVVDARLSTLERKLDFLEASLENCDPSKRQAKTSQFKGSIFDPQIRQKLIAQNQQKTKQNQRLFNKIVVAPNKSLVARPIIGGKQTSNIQQPIQQQQQQRIQQQRIQQQRIQQQQQQKKTQSKVQQKTKPKKVQSKVQPKVQPKTQPKTQSKSNPKSNPKPKPKQPPSVPSSAVIVPPPVPSSSVIVPPPVPNIAKKQQQPPPIPQQPPKPPSNPISLQKKEKKEKKEEKEKEKEKEQEPGSIPPPAPKQPPQPPPNPISSSSSSPSIPPPAPKQSAPKQSAPKQSAPPIPPGSAAPKQVKQEWPNTSSSGIDILILKQGTGSIPGGQSAVEIEYTGNLPNGKQFIKHREVIQLGKKQNIKGLEQAVTRIKVGCEIKLWIPSRLAYGARGAGNLIPPNADLTFHLQLHRIVKQ